MRAMVVRRYGPPKNLELQNVPEPTPKADEVLIGVRTVGINFADLLQRMGLYPSTPKPPFIPGFEVAGVIERAAGPGEEAGRLAPQDNIVAKAEKRSFRTRLNETGARAVGTS